MPKNEAAERSKLPHMQREITCSNNSTSDDINLSEYFPLSRNFLFSKIALMFSEILARYAAGGCVNAFF